MEIFEAKIFPCMSNFKLKLKNTKNFVIAQYTIDCFQLFKTSGKAKTNKNFVQ